MPTFYFFFALFTCTVGIPRHAPFPLPSSLGLGDYGDLSLSPLSSGQLVAILERDLSLIDQRV